MVRACRTMILHRALPVHDDRNRGDRFDSDSVMVFTINL
jgi:hypothetical protein